MNRKERTIRTNTARIRAWLAMRVLVNFDIDEIVSVANIGYSNAKQYTTCLFKTGYLRRTKSGLLLVRNTGVKAPVMVQENSKYRMYDPNIKGYFEGMKEKRTNEIKNIYAINRLKKAVIQYGQAKVAKMLKLSETTVCLVAKGKYPASTKNIEKKIKEVL